MTGEKIWIYDRYILNICDIKFINCLGLNNIYMLIEEKFLDANRVYLNYK